MASASSCASARCSSASSRIAARRTAVLSPSSPISAAALYTNASSPPVARTEPEPNSVSAARPRPGGRWRVRRGRGRDDARADGGRRNRDRAPRAGRWPTARPAPSGTPRARRPTDRHRRARRPRGGAQAITTDRPHRVTCPHERGVDHLQRARVERGARAGTQAGVELVLEHVAAASSGARPGPPRGARPAGRRGEPGPRGPRATRRRRPRPSPPPRATGRRDRRIAGSYVERGQGAVELAEPGPRRRAPDASCAGGRRRRSHT